MSSDRYDVAVVGAGPAGATAATLLARSGRRVALIDDRPFPRPAVCAGLLNPQAEPLLTRLEAPVDSLLRHPFRETFFYNEDFTKVAQPKVQNVLGYLVDRTEFDHALVETARNAGAEPLLGAPIHHVQVFEDHVEVEREQAASITARMLASSTGRGTRWLSQLGLDRRGGGPSLWCGIARGADPNPAARPARVIVVLGMNQGNSFSTCVVSEASVSVTIHWRGEKKDARPALARLCHLLHQKRILDVDLTREAAQTEIVFCSSSFALDMDTHVGKNTLLIGDAGGFVSAASHEGIYPAMWSARIASDVIDDALASKHPQDALKSFETRWRHEMASYLRPPNTEMQFLLPLIFSNQVMADRMAAAFFCGENL